MSAARTTQGEWEMNAPRVIEDGRLPSKAKERPPCKARPADRSIQGVSLRRRDQVPGKRLSRVGSLPALLESQREAV